MLQARVFSYAGAHHYRLGTHDEALPVNAPKCPAHNYHKDGQVTALFNLFDEGQKSRLFMNTAEAMQGVPSHIIERQPGHLAKVHPDYGNGVRTAIAELSNAQRAAE